MRPPNGRPSQEPSAEPLVQAFNRVTHKIQEFRLLPGLPSIKEISQMSDNANKKRRNWIKGIPQGLNDMGHKITQASRNVHGNIRRRYQGIRKTLLHPIRPGDGAPSLQPQMDREVLLNVEALNAVLQTINSISRSHWSRFSTGWRPSSTGSGCSPASPASARSRRCRAT